MDVAAAPSRIHGVPITSFSCVVSAEWRNGYISMRTAHDAGGTNCNDLCCHMRVIRAFSVAMLLDPGCVVEGLATGAAAAALPVLLVAMASIWSGNLLMSQGRDWGRHHALKVS